MLRERINSPKTVQAKYFIRYDIQGTPGDVSINVLRLLPS